MQYNDMAIALLAESSENYIYCYASDISYEDAINDSTIYLIDSYSPIDKAFEDVHYSLHYYVVPLTMVPVQLPTEEEL